MLNLQSSLTTFSWYILIGNSDVICPWDRATNLAGCAKLHGHNREYTTLPGQRGQRVPAEWVLYEVVFFKIISQSSSFVTNFNKTLWANIAKYSQPVSQRSFRSEIQDVPREGILNWISSFSCPKKDVWCTRQKLKSKWGQTRCTTWILGVIFIKFVKGVWLIWIVFMEIKHLG